MTLTVLDILWDTIESSQFECSEDRLLLYQGMPSAFGLRATINNVFTSCYYVLFSLVKFLESEGFLAWII